MKSTEVLNSKKRLSTEIEHLRNRMVHLGSHLGFLHPDVQLCSSQLDDLIVQYYEIHTF
ncbi:aspartyl-phosphate phosphatase Spo0E family protein [Paenibacillus eucommiae]|uniref:Aspartyl-phosphate phosphatase Spo0E family protein n=1 Tax=Paenibacillus eucommiae TaxID=1355755 RepID=A0ABS4IWQ6_9BACL|nr:aspartyl-phosphate phosphatase Spo0E family protein [Paenibacillus eucommiae]MBP1992014.1 hypothetical protein [Paenibacillus eucommiae]